MAVVSGRLLTAALQPKPESLTQGPGIGPQITSLVSPLTSPNLLITSPIGIGVSNILLVCSEGTCKITRQWMQYSIEPCQIIGSHA